MASIFLSYARGDAAKAGRIANAFEAAGHFVWWDQHIGTGSRFSSEIDEALRNAEMVVVLWSELSIRSAWVLDEAAVGRDTARLVPVLIEDVLPPLGFRQFQALPLTGTLRGKRALQPLLDAVAAGVKPELGVASPVRRGPVVLPRWAMVAMVALLMAGLATSSSTGSRPAMARRRSRSRRPRVATVVRKSWRERLRPILAGIAPGRWARFPSLVAGRKWATWTIGSRSACPRLAMSCAPISACSRPKVRRSSGRRLSKGPPPGSSIFANEHW